MREYILTDKERRAIEKFLKDRKPTNLVYVLRHRTTKFFKRLDKDVELLLRLMEDSKANNH